MSASCPVLMQLRNGWLDVRVTQGSRALHRPLLLFEGGDEQCGASSRLWGEVAWRHAPANQEITVGSAWESGY